MADEVRRFERVIGHVLRWEGGYVDDPNDPGGETKFGISARSYPDLDIEALTEEDAQAIYFNDYWLKIRGDELTSERLALGLMDFAVNAGAARAVRVAQEAAQGLRLDGRLGPLTLTRFNALGEPFVAEFTCARIAYYTRLAHSDPKRRGYLLGWIRRALDAAGLLEA